MQVHVHVHAHDAPIPNRYSPERTQEYVLSLEDTALTADTPPLDNFPTFQ